MAAKRRSTPSRAKPASTTTRTGNNRTACDDHGVTHAVDFENAVGGTQWNAHTTCGRYLRVTTVSQSPMRAVTCIECTVRLTRWRPEPGILRGKSYDAVYIDEAKDIAITNPCGEIDLADS